MIIFSQIHRSVYLFFPDRNEIYKKVDNRYLKMIDDGAIEEVALDYAFALKICDKI